ncbi:MAG: hypothetical protein L0Z54_06190 [Thermoplasmata archaeon]|nr:hypothetical protein [Thermoplasmata archaeon]
MKAAVPPKNRLLLVIIIVGILLVAGVAAYSMDDDDDDGGGGGTPEGPGPSGNNTVERFEGSGTATGAGGIGMNGNFEFPVEEGAVKVIVNLTGVESTGMEDLDLEVESANGGVKSSGNPGTTEQVTYDRLDIQKRDGYGTYRATIVAYAAVGVQYTITAEVFYPSNSTA